MIKAKTDWGGCEVEVRGVLPVLCADTATLLKGIYDAIAEKDKGLAEEYKSRMEDDLIKIAFHPEVVRDELKSDEVGKVYIEVIDKIFDFLKEGLSND